MTIRAAVGGGPQEPAGGRGTITLVGAGLGGSLMAILLGREGYTVRGFEMRPDPRADPRAGGRSINLALSARGMHALGEAGLLDAITALAVPMRGRMIHAPSGETAFQPYGTAAWHANHSVSRADLNIALLNAAERFPNVRYSFGSKCVDVDPDTATLTLLDAATGRGTDVRSDAIIAADGAYSAVRRQLQARDRFDYRQSYLTHGYKELTIPAGADGAFRLEKNALHIWPRGGFMMIALPNIDGSFTCTLFWPFEGPNSFAALADERDVVRFFEKNFSDASPLMPDLAAEYFRNPTGSLVTISCSPWHEAGRVLLLGDACHAVVPFHGQGANAAFEDCVVLRDCLREHAADLGTAFAAFETRRKVHTDALAALSIANFEEMRDHTASRLFRARKSLEKTLHRLFPSWYVPLYMMVTFTRIPYADAVRREARQQRLVGIAAGSILLLLTLALVLCIHGGY